MGNVLDSISRINQVFQSDKNPKERHEKILASQDHECAYTMRYKNFDKFT